jgi:chitin disaccharide deacetylase
VNKKKILIVNADDFGLHPDIDMGITECINRGIVNSISICPNGTSIDWNKIRELQSIGVNIGIHLTFVGEKWQTKPYHFFSWKNLLIKLLLNPNKILKEINKEGKYQIETCLKENIHLTHLDSHQHCHLFPGIWGICFKYLKNYNIARIRLPYVTSWLNCRTSLPGIGLQILSILKKRKTDFLPCIGLQKTGQNTRINFETELKRSKKHDLELIIHPGNSTYNLKKEYRDWGFHWSQEKNFLLSIKFQEIIDKYNYSLDLNEFKPGKCS